MQFKTTYIMAFILLILGLYIFYVDIPKSDKRKSEEKAAKKIIHFEKDDLREFSLFLDEEIVMKRDENDGWLMIKPVNAKGDKRESEGVVSRLNAVTLSRIVDKGNDNLKTYGLLNNSFKIRLKIKGEDKFIYIGYKTPLGNGVYVKRGWDNQVFLAGKYIKDDLIKKSVFDLRDKTIFDFKKEDLLNVNIINPNKLDIIKGDNGYRVLSTSNEKADEYEVNSLLNKIKDLKVKKFVYENEIEESSYFTPSKRTISVNLKDNRSKELIIGEENNGFYYSKFKDESKIFMLSKNEIDTILNVNFFDLRDKSLFTINNNDIKKINIIYPKKTITLKKRKNNDEDNEWELISPINARANEVRVETLISSLLDLELESIYDGDIANIDESYLKIVLHKGDDTILGKLNILFTDENKNGISKSGKFKETFIINSDDIEKLSRLYVDLKDRRILTFKDDNIKEVSIKQLDKARGAYVEVKIEKIGKRWKSFLPEKTSVDEMKIRPLLWTLSDLEYVENVLNDDIKTDKNGLLKPNFIITLTLDDNSNQKVSIGNELAGKDLVFVNVLDNTYHVKKESVESLYLMISSLLKDLN